MAVARSSVFSAWRLQNAGCAMRRRRRSASDMPSASWVVFRAARNPSAARSSPTFRMRSAKTGSNSTQWPSPSRSEERRVGKERRSRLARGQLKKKYRTDEEVIAVSAAGHNDVWAPSGCAANTHHDDDDVV